MRGISKSFGPTPVLRKVDFDLRAGEIHALMGENGAGKSTLMKIAAGLIDHFEGESMWPANDIEWPLRAMQRGRASR